MATSATLATLIDLALKETDEAAKRLAAALRVGQEASEKLALLTQYRDDYTARCQSELANGLSTTQLHNYQVFMQKLDHAIAGQQKVVDGAQRQIAAARAAWQACEQKKMSFTALAGRAKKEETRRELWRDQKQNDEHAARRVLPKRNPT